MPEWVWILIIAPPSVWRLTHMVWNEKVMTKFRYLFGERFDFGTGKPTYPNTWYGYLIDCFLCLSVWVGLIFTILIFIFPYILLPFFLSALAIWIQEVREKCLT